MIEKSITFKTFEDCQRFCNIASKQDYGIDLKVGNRTVDAKSLEGIYSLGLDKELTIRANTDNADEFFNQLNDF